jgi:hypothetical protein
MLRISIALVLEDYPPIGSGRTFSVGDMSNDQNSMSPPAERRPKPRKRVLLKGIVTYGNGTFSFDCIFRNLSETGARIDVGNNSQIPSTFHLINVRDSVVYKAKQVWHRGTEVGVSFEETVPLSAITDPGLGYLKKLWLAKASH